MSVTREELTRLFIDADVGWYLEHERDIRLKQFREEAQALSKELARRSRLGSPVDVLSEMLSDSDKFVPLVQTFVMPMTTPVRALVYCLLSGARLTSLSYKYVFKKKSALEATAEFGPGREMLFTSTEHWDAEVLHHLGLAKLSGRPFIDGYFPFRGRRSP